MMLVQMNPAVVLGQMNPDFVPGTSALDRLHQGGFFFSSKVPSVFSVLMFSSALKADCLVLIFFLAISFGVVAFPKSVEVRSNP